MIKYVAFDFDGTLVDSKAVFISVFNQLATRHNFLKIVPENLHHLRSLSMIERFDYLKVPLYKLPFLTSKFLSLYNESLTAITIVPGLKSVVETLKNKGFSIAIISTNSERNIRMILEHHQLDITDVYCSSKLFGKHRIIRKFLDKKRLKASEVLYVGDEHRDLIACKKNQVKMIWVSWGYDSDAIIDSADFMAHTPEDIISILTSEIAK